MWQPEPTTARIDEPSLNVVVQRDLSRFGRELGEEVPGDVSEHLDEELWGELGGGVVELGGKVAPMAFALSTRAGPMALPRGLRA